MGGNAFPVTSRLNQSTYHRFVVTAKENPSYGNSFVIPESILEKEDHGDIDILVSEDYFKQVSRSYTLPIPALIATIFRVSAIEIKHLAGSNVYNCLIHGNYQVDVTVVKNLSMANFFYSYNDLGGLFGSLLTAHEPSLKLKADGLYLAIREESGLIKEDILLTENYREILEVLGLPGLGSFYPKIFFENEKFINNTFGTYESMFENLSFSYLFKTDAFESPSNRDKKRLTYQKLTEWVSINKDILESRPSAFLPLQRLWMKIHKISKIDIFNHLISLEKKYSELLLMKQKFNGKLVKEITDLDGQELGQFMNDLRAIPFWDKLVYNSTPEQLKDYISEFYRVSKTSTSNQE